MVIVNNLLLIIYLLFTLLILFLGLIGMKFALDIYKYNKSSKGWLSVLLTMIVVPLWAFYRIYIIAYSQVSYQNLYVGGIDLVLFPLLALIPLVIGIWYMRKSFQEFEITSAITREKARNVQRKK